MANTFKGRQIIIDASFATVIEHKLFKGDLIQWNLIGGAAGNQAVIQSKDGSYIYNGVAPGANFMDRMILNRDYPDGFTVPTLSSGGTLIITRN